MTPERDIERILEAWMAQGSSRMPDRLFDAVVDQVERVPQRRGWRSAPRFPSMQTMLKLTVAAVFALVVGIAGVGFLSGPTVMSPAASPSPAAPPSPSASLQASPAEMLPMSFGPIRPEPTRSAAPRARTAPSAA